MKKIFGFTLAELMLAMSIVGAVAALTIPTLHYQRVKQEYSAKLKTFYSRMSNAVMDMTAEKGSFRNHILRDGENAGYEWYMQNLDPYIGHLGVLEDKHRVFLRDGSQVTLYNKNPILFVEYDVNGEKAPNRLGHDLYMFVFVFNNEARKRFFGDSNTFFGPYGEDLWQAGIVRDKIVDVCREDPIKCSYLLMIDQWEYARDYPIKF